MREEFKPLKNHSRVLADPMHGQLARFIVEPADFHAAAFYCFQGIDHTKTGGLSTARGTDQTQAIALKYIQIELTQNMLRALRADKGFGHTTHSNQSFHGSYTFHRAPTLRRFSR
jgi:hypothetical protein